MPEHPKSGRGKTTRSVDAAITSVRQWRYDPPFEAPLTFTVQVRLEGCQVMEFHATDDGDALRVGGNIKPPMKIKDVRPVYPPVAREAKASRAWSSSKRASVPTARVEEAHVLKSIPLLDQAALDAVKQWQFAPTLMNGSAGARHHDRHHQLHAQLIRDP